MSFRFPFNEWIPVPGVETDVLYRLIEHYGD